MNMIRRIGRLAFRGDGKKDGLFIGVFFKHTKDIFKPNHIYEIQEILEQIFIKDMGPSILSSGKDQVPMGFLHKKNIKLFVEEKDCFRLRELPL